MRRLENLKKKRGTLKKVLVEDLKLVLEPKLESRGQKLKNIIKQFSPENSDFKFCAQLNELFHQG